MLQPGQALQTHLQNLLRLGVRQAVQAVAAHAIQLFQAVWAVVVGIDHAAVGAGAGEHLAHQLAVPRFSHQLHFGYRRGRRIADEGNELVNIGQRHRQAFKYMATFAGLAQVEHRAPRHHLAPVLQKDLHQVFQVAQLGLPVN